MSLTKITQNVTDIQELGNALNTESSALKTALDAKLSTLDVSTVWTADNDGPGSGLDADLLDGVDSSAIAFSGHTLIANSVAVNGTTVIESDGKIDWDKIKNTPTISSGGIERITTSNCGNQTTIGHTNTATRTYITMYNNSNCACGNVCFLPEQEVRMADGSVKKISEVDANDRVIDQNGDVTNVIGIRIVELGERPMFDIQSGLVVTTGDHLIKTEDGWKCADIENFKGRSGVPMTIQNQAGDDLGVVESCSIEVQASGLSVGDMIVRLDASSIEIDSIEEVETSPSTIVYTLCTNSGTFVLDNGIIVDGMPQRSI